MCIYKNKITLLCYGDQDHECLEIWLKRNVFISFREIKKAVSYSAPPKSLLLSVLFFVSHVILNVVSPISSIPSLSSSLCACPIPVLRPAFLEAEQNKCGWMSVELPRILYKEKIA